VQITATRHAIKTACGVSVAAVGNTCCDILISKYQNITAGVANSSSVL